jgi:osmotically-inducible protein OsmY
MSTATVSANDVRVRDAVVRQLYWDPQVDASAIGVAVNDGAVTLTGFIDSCASKLAAERAAKQVRGVRAVANDIDVRPMMDRTDSDIAADVVRVLRARDSVPEAVQAAVHDGYVTLTGAVQWLFQKSDAEDAVRHVRGVRRVTNYTTVTPQPIAHDIQERIVKVLRHNADVDAQHIQVSVAGDIATLTGSVANWLQFESAERAAANAPGIREVINRLMVNSPSDHDPDEIC